MQDMQKDMPDTTGTDSYQHPGGDCGRESLPGARGLPSLPQMQAAGCPCGAGGPGRSTGPPCLFWRLWRQSLIRMRGVFLSRSLRAEVRQKGMDAAFPIRFFPWARVRALQSPCRVLHTRDHAGRGSSISLPQQCVSISS